MSIGVLRARQMAINAAKPQPYKIVPRPPKKKCFSELVLETLGTDTAVAFAIGRERCEDVRRRKYQVILQFAYTNRHLGRFRIRSMPSDDGLSVLFWAEQKKAKSEVTE